MDRKPYTVENQRPRRTVTLYGATLAPLGRGRTSQKDLELLEVLAEPCMRLIRARRLKVVRGDLDALASELRRIEEPAQAPDPVAELIDSPAEEPLEVPAEAAAPEGGELVSDAPPSAEAVSLEESVVPAEVEILPEAVALPTPWTYESLKALSAAEQKEICKAMDLAANGREDERIARILEAQASAGGEE